MCLECPIYSFLGLESYLGKGPVESDGIESRVQGVCNALKTLEHDVRGLFIPTLLVCSH